MIVLTTKNSQFSHFRHCRFLKLQFNPINLIYRSVLDALNLKIRANDSLRVNIIVIRLPYQKLQNCSKGHTLFDYSRCSLCFVSSFCDVKRFKSVQCCFHFSPTSFDDGRVQPLCKGFSSTPQFLYQLFQWGYSNAMFRLSLEAESSSWRGCFL